MTVLKEASQHWHTTEQPRQKTWIYSQANLNCRKIREKNWKKAKNGYAFLCLALIPVISSTEWKRNTKKEEEKNVQSGKMYFFTVSTAARRQCETRTVTPNWEKLSQQWKMHDVSSHASVQKTEKYLTKSTHTPCAALSHFYHFSHLPFSQTWATIGTLTLGILHMA